ncbi:MAG: hypothetical protein NWE93_04575 [Candidatus Bathyarchaeota archaeon]|nr:hypothetical protein [Candidatus Bathyarchaeota archaeon]
MHGAVWAMIRLALTVLLALVVTVYMAFAYWVASYVQTYAGRLGWANAGSTFLPWPTTPTGPNISVIEFLNQTDTLYYQIIIQTGVLIILTVILWLAVFWVTWRLRGKVKVKSEKTLCPQ